MQCAKCHTTFEASTAPDGATSCPKCGALVAPEGAAGRRRGISGLALMFLFLLLAMAAVAVGSSIYAVQAIKERDRSREDFAQSTTAIDSVVAAAAGSAKLKGPANTEARAEVLQPALNYYQAIAEKYADDEQMLPQVASARLHLAALQARVGSPECVNSLNAGLAAVNGMIKADFPEKDFPGFQATALKIAAPMDWVQVKTNDLQSHVIGLFFAIKTAAGTYHDLATKFPKSVVFRDDLSALLKSSATLEMNIPGRGVSAARTWDEARDVLETLVRDQPSNEEFQTRLLESLATAARLQAPTERDKAIANLKRAVEVRQKMADAKPDDKAIADGLAKAQSDLEKLAATPPPKVEPPKDESPKQEAPKEEDAPKDAAPAETP